MAAAAPESSRSRSSDSGGARAALVVGALGIVFGDIGTSPLYTVQTVFNPGDPHPVAQSAETIYGIASLIFWAVTLVVTIQYVTFVMRADNRGEGGIMALITLVHSRRTFGSAKAKVVLIALGVFGASLFFGDSMITPAISVLSAVEGLKVVEPSLESLIVPITAAIIVVLFAFQRFGTAKVSRLFGPVMVCWFLAIAAFGIAGISVRPEVLEALSPIYALDFLTGNFSTAFFALAAVVLAVTGAEALYADLGHFGRRPITYAWVLAVFPACALCYLGQAALLLDEPGRDVAGLFFLLVPEWGQLPMVFLATAATVIASQAVISGAFSVAHQAVQLGYLPRLRVVHTSARTEGQIYVPAVNWILLVAVLLLVFAFQSSVALAYAFGMAVTATITITALLYLFVARHRWGYPLWVVAAGGSVLLAVDLLFFAANLTKVLHGAWLPLLIALAVFTVMTTWRRGRELLAVEREREEGSLREFVAALHDRRPTLRRVPGTAVFLNRNQTTTPLAMRANVEHNRILHEHAVVLTIETVPVPQVPDADRITVDDLGYADDGITHLTARFGYLQHPDVPAALRLAVATGVECPLEVDEASYFLSRVELRIGPGRGMSRWRKRLFLASSQITADAAAYFRLPPARTVVMGSVIEI